MSPRGGAKGRQKVEGRGRTSGFLFPSCPAGAAQQGPFTGTPPPRQLIPVCTGPSLCRYPLVKRPGSVLCGPEAVAPAKLPSKLLKPNSPSLFSVPRPSALAALCGYFSCDISGFPFYLFHFLIPSVNSLYEMLTVRIIGVIYSL